LFKEERPRKKRGRGGREKGKGKREKGKGKGNRFHRGKNRARIIL
jgi:hypothetical protein